MLLLIDLDGTLTDTAHAKFKPYKDGLQETLLQNIPLINGAIEFVTELQKQGHKPVIISDSHPKYVNKIAKEVFRIPALSLADKPNPLKTYDYLKNNYSSVADLKNGAIVIGDTWLDVELGRTLNCPTILTNFYKASSEEKRDGIGQDWKHLKSGATYYADKFSDIYEILKNPEQNLLAVEAVFRNCNSCKAVKFKTNKYSDRFVAYRALGRQNSGECDKYGVADKYFEFQRTDRTNETLKKLAKATENFLSHVISSLPDIKWHYITYVSDKATTTPPNKMKELFDLVSTPIEKRTLILWKENIKGSIRNQIDWEHRRDFVKENIFISEKTDLKDKNLIIIDDQFTTGGTAYSICGKFWDLGVKNVIFVTLFYLITTIESGKVCPKCGKRLQVKIKRADGTRFYSCVGAKYGGSGCGNYIQNIG